MTKEEIDEVIRLLTFAAKEQSDRLGVPVLSTLQGQAAQALQQQKKEQDEAAGLIDAAKCPCCNGDGAYYGSMGEACQCQWCHESKAFRKKIGERG
jgi:hypothetical protein